MKKVFRLATLGCRTNQYETQGYRKQLLELGYREAEEGEEADLCIVNTCTVTESADSNSRHEIRQLIRKNKGAKVVVTGCMAESHPDQILAIDGVSKIIPNARKEELIQDLFPEIDVPEFAINHFEAHTRAFVKVQDGCNSFCTYCVIPYVRGRSRSRPVEDVLREVRALVENGYKEVVITGINVGDYDGGGSTTLAELIREVDQVEGLERLRLSSIDPDEVNGELQEAILSGRITCPSLHLVLQSGSNAILKRMNRKYTRQIFMETVDRLRQASPDFTFTTDVIVGFPGESEEDFEQTLSVMDEVQFAKVHMFPYSKRERTRAFSYPNQVAHEVIQERKARVMKRAEENAFALRERFLGRTMKVLCEDGTSGHTENFLSVLLPQTEKNTIVQAHLSENTPQGLIGR